MFGEADQSSESTLQKRRANNQDNDEFDPSSETIEN